MHESRHFANNEHSRTRTHKNMLLTISSCSVFRPCVTANVGVRHRARPKCQKCVGIAAKQPQVHKENVAGFSVSSDNNKCERGVVGMSSPGVSFLRVKTRESGVRRSSRAASVRVKASTNDDADSMVRGEC